MITTFRPERGNLAEFGNYLCEGVVSDPRVTHVDVIANIVRGAPELEQVSERLTVRRLWRLGSAPSLQSLLWKVPRLRPDIVHLNAGIRTWGRGRAVSLVGAALAAQLRLAGMRTVTTLHHIGETMRFDESIQSALKLDPITMLGMKAASALYLKSNVVTVTLGTMQRALQEAFGPVNVAHLPHGTFGARVAEPPNPSPLRVLSFGFWGAFKDADLLVEAVRGVRAKGIDVELVLGGGPHPYVPEIYAQMREKYRDLGFVRFTGYIPEEQLGELFQSVSLLVLPYRTNSGASGVLNLARSYGRPVVISNDPGLLEQIRYEGGAALVFHDHHSLEHALTQVLSDPQLRQRMGEENLEVARRLTIGTQATQLVTLFQQLCSGRPVLLPQSPVLAHGYVDPLPSANEASLYSFQPAA